LLRDEEAKVRAAAARAVVAIDPGTKQTLVDQKGLLKPEREVVERRAAAQGLKRMVASLEGRQPDQTQTFRAELVAAAGLGLFDKKDANVRLLCLETIQQALQRSDQQANTSRTLAMAVNKQTPAVVALLEDADLKVCLAAHQVLEGIAAERRNLRGATIASRDEKGPADQTKRLDAILVALPKLKGNLAKEKQLRVRLAALYVLETLGDEAAGVVDEVTKIAEDQNGFVRWGAVRVLHNMAQEQAEKAVPALARRLTDDNKTVRLAAAQALARYGRQAKPAVKALEMALGDSEPQVRLAATNALAAIGPPARQASDAIIKLLLDTEQKPELRSAAAKALGRFGSLQESAKKTLTQALDDHDFSVRQAASETLLEKD
jgi:HEAT repeat protein